MGDPRDYVASSLVNGEDEEEELRRLSEGVHPPQYGNVPVSLPREILDPVPAQPEGFMDAQPFTAARAHIDAMSPEERERAGLGGMAYGAGRAALESIPNPLEGIGEAVFGKQDPVTNPPGGVEPPVVRAQEGTDDQTIVPSTIGYRDGVFTNINVTDKDRAAYRGGVSSFRERMRADQDALGPPPKGTATTPGGHITGDPDAPLPGDKGTYDPERGEVVGRYPEGGAVSYPAGEVADPTKALTEEGWAAMMPGAQRSYMEQVGEISGTRQVAAAGEVAAHNARMATDPKYAVQIRFGPYFTFYNMAKDHPETQMAAQQVVNEMAKSNPAIVQGSPEYERALEMALNDAARTYLNREHAAIAPWDEVFSKALGLTFQ